MSLLDGNLGIARKRMPQLVGFPLPGGKAAALPRDPALGGVDLGPQFWAELVAAGHKLKHYRIAPSYLYATQRELDMEKVYLLCARMREGTLPEQCVFISNDGHIVDGHHRWAASVIFGVKDIPVSQIDMPICEIIKEALRFQKEWGL